ncbi:methyltransferase domain-containing protein [Paenibacillus sp. MWE-103]|uniref:Methyltransferase domain-containing protein n=1 Tax=Paenibacillus artemisiicola TaxID=1172618 RepID=A0ABS3WCS4_9BACL|nr:methyltransferase domain-containing protein [Paenibacillus artemisiicola]MBO7746106.1 methyltransferase domain-containing protein [Paenibacillus artemisiicola]
MTEAMNAEAQEPAVGERRDENRESPRLRRVDLGCGAAKHRDCVGLDASAAAQPDLVHDFDDPLPFEDDSVTFLLACRSLEYAKDLRGLMKEIYRVCRHKAIVCIVAPHAQAAVHIANPGVRSPFNEYTPYYLTPKEHHRDMIAAAQFSPEFIPAESVEVDFRLLRMEFFYFPLYLSPLYEPAERIGLMEVQLNMVDEILYHFVVAKAPIGKEELARLAGNPLEEPARITERRRQDGLLARSGTGNVIEPSENAGPEGKTGRPKDKAVAPGRNGRPEARAGEKAKPEGKARADGKAKPDEQGRAGEKTKPDGKGRSDGKGRPESKAKPKAARSGAGRASKRQIQIKMVEPERELVRRPSKVMFERKE